MGSFSPSAAGNGYCVASTDVSGADGVAAAEPWILPPAFIPPNTTTPGKLQVTVASVAGAKWANVPLPRTNADFALTWPNGNSSALITAGATSNVWNAAPTARAALATAYDQMRQDLETLEGQQVLAPGAAYSIWQAVAEALPLPFSEVLQYRYGFDTAARTVDLLPGMRVRVEQATGEFSSPSSPFNGFVGSGSSYWYVDRRSADQAIVFDPFIGALAPYQPASSTTGIWGVVDAQSAGASRHFRLAFPPGSQNSFAPWPGSGTASQNVTLIGATSIVDLEEATADYVAGRPVPTQGATKQPISCTFFRGRAVVVPEFPVLLAQGFAYVPVGTTLRGVAQRFLSGQLNASAVGYGRIWTPTVRGTGTTQTPVTGMDQAPAVPNGDSPDNGWDLPVVKGDQLAIK